MAKPLHLAENLHLYSIARREVVFRALLRMVVSARSVDHPSSLRPVLSHLQLYEQESHGKIDPNDIMLLSVHGWVCQSNTSRVYIMIKRNLGLSNRLNDLQHILMIPILINAFIALVLEPAFWLAHIQVHGFPRGITERCIRVLSVLVLRLSV